MKFRGSITFIFFYIMEIFQCTFTLCTSLVTSSSFCKIRYVFQNSTYIFYVLYSPVTPKKKTNFEISIERENRDEFEKSKIPRVSTVGKRDVKHHACRVNRFVVVARHAHTNSKSGITRSVETSTAVPPMYWRIIRSNRSPLIAEPLRNVPRDSFRKFYSGRFSTRTGHNIYLSSSIFFDASLKRANHQSF